MCIPILNNIFYIYSKIYDRNHLANYEGFYFIFNNPIEYFLSIQLFVKLV